MFNRQESNVKLILDFKELIELLLKEELIDEETFEEIKKYIYWKTQSLVSVLDKGPRIEKLDKWIKDQFERFDKEIKSESDGFINKQQNETSLCKQSLISIYRKLENEEKKIKLITEKNSVINRTEYLNAIGFCLQLLWLIKHPTQTNFPSKISQLLSETYSELQNNVKLQIKEICEKGDY